MHIAFEKVSGGQVFIILLEDWLTCGPVTENERNRWVKEDERPLGGDLHSF